MSPIPALSFRSALSATRECAPQSCHICDEALSRIVVATDFAVRYGGVPANGLPRNEDVVLYTRVEDATVPVLLGLYGDRNRVRSWLPGLPRRTNRESVERLLASTKGPVQIVRPPCQEQTKTANVDLMSLPVLQATPRDAGPYLTAGVVYARDPQNDEIALSVHRMLVLDGTHLTMWMVPGRRLRALCHEAVMRGERLPVSINIGAPPAAMIASALNTEFLPEGITKLDIAGALAGGPVTLAPAISQPTSVLAESEIVLEGYLDGAMADECVGRRAPDVSLPEFLGYDGTAKTNLPVVTVTAMSTRQSALYQAIIGPGREQSTILGLAGALSVVLSEARYEGCLIGDLYFSPAGGGMLLLIVQVRKDSPEADALLTRIARRIFEHHPFVELIIFTDEDVNITSEEDVFWAVTTRANLGTDCVTFSDFPRLAMDPSQREDWTVARGGNGLVGRTFIDATIPYRLRKSVSRSFPSMVED